MPNLHWRRACSCAIKSATCAESIVCAISAVTAAAAAAACSQPREEEGVLALVKGDLR